MSTQSMTTNSNTLDTQHTPLNPINHDHSMELELLPINEWSSLETKLIKLGLGAMIEHQDQIRAQPTMAMQLNTLCELELNARHQKSFTYRQKASKLPIHKPISQFDWQWIKGSLQGIKRIASLGFMAEQGNALLIGDAGTGKTMIACNAGMEALARGYTVYYTVARHLLSELELITHGTKLRNKLKKIARYDLLIIDELGYGDHTARQADLLYEIVASRNGLKSTLITSNLLISQWYGLFDNQSMIIPTIDRFVERCDMVKIDAQSYRYKTSEEKIRSLGE